MAHDLAEMRCDHHSGRPRPFSAIWRSAGRFC
jgi:hypothetical protein